MVAWNHLYNLKKSVPLVSVLKREMCNFITQVSIIIPVHNGVQWLNDCLQSIKSQTALSTMLLEVSVFDDSSTDGTAKVLTEWSDKLEQYESIKVTVSHGEGSPKGVGFAKNRAVEQSCGQFLCFFDVDDIMLPDRISLQHKSALERPDTVSSVTELVNPFSDL